MILGFASYVYPKTSLSHRVTLGPVHRFLGMSSWLIGLATMAVRSHEEFTPPGSHELLGSSSHFLGESSDLLHPNLSFTQFIPDRHPREVDLCIDLDVAFGGRPVLGGDEDPSDHDPGSGAAGHGSAVQSGETDGLRNQMAVL